MKIGDMKIKPVVAAAGHSGSAAPIEAAKPATILVIYTAVTLSFPVGRLSALSAN